MSKVIEIDEEDFKSLFDDYETWAKTLKEVEERITFLQQSFVAMLKERDKLFTSLKYVDSPVVIKTKNKEG